MTNNEREMLEYREQIDNGDPSVGSERFEISERLLSSLIRKLFSSNASVAEITDFVRSVNSGLSSENRFDLLAAEAVVRDALGEEAVSLAGIGSAQINVIRNIISFAAIQSMSVSESVIANFVIAAERDTLSRGARPE